MNPNPTEEVLHNAQELHEENQRLRAELKQQEKLYEQAHLELIQHMVESERQAKELKRLNSLLTKAYLNTIEIIQRLIELREPGYTEHANRVAEISPHSRNWENEYPRLENMWMEQAFRKDWQEIPSHWARVSLPWSITGIPFSL